MIKMIKLLFQQIEDLITSSGDGFSSDLLVREFDERMSNVQLIKGGWLSVHCT